MHALPVGERSAGDDQRAEQLRPQRSEDHYRPSGLTIADHTGFAVGIGMTFDYLLYEYRFGARDPFDSLARHGFRQEADEIAGMACLHGDTDLAVCLEATDARTMAGTRVDDNERPAFHFSLDTLGRDDAHQRIVDGLLQLAAI